MQAIGSGKDPGRLPETTVWQWPQCLDLTLGEDAALHRPEVSEMSLGCQNASLPKSHRRIEAIKVINRLSALKVYAFACDDRSNRCRRKDALRRGDVQMDFNGCICLRIYCSSTLQRATRGRSLEQMPVSTRRTAQLTESSRRCLYVRTLGLQILS
eukprot:scaffold379120_cov14-Prasinocladus_malaysianus.AAC.1